MCNHALLPHQRMHPHGTTETNKSRHSIVSFPPLYVDVAHTASSLSRSRTRLADVSANIFVEIPDYTNINISPHCDSQQV